MELFRSIAGSLHIDGQVVIAQSIAFLVLLIGLGKFLYKPIEAIMRQRQEQIARSLDGAEVQRTKAEELKKEYEAHLTNIADEAKARLDQAMRDAEAARQRLLDAANVEIHELHERHLGQLALEREQLRRDLRNEMSEIAVMAAGKALRSQLTPTLQSAVVDQVILELDKPTATTPTMM